MRFQLTNQDYVAELKSLETQYFIEEMKKRNQESMMSMARSLEENRQQS